MERELPIVNIEGTEFIVDVMAEELREKSNPQNIMNIQEMDYVGDGYSFRYDPGVKNLPDEVPIELLDEDRELMKVKLPELIALDPVGMAEKYNLTIEEIKGKTDFDLMVTEGNLHLRWNKGILPTLEIAGDVFCVDLAEGKLLLKDGSASQYIPFAKLWEYFDQHAHSYIIPYNPITHQMQEVNHQTITELPKEIVIVQFPHEYELDRVGWNKKHGFDLSRGLEYLEPKLNIKARTLPWHQTNIPERIKLNLEKKMAAQKEEKPEISSTSKVLPKIKKGRGI